MAAQGAGSRPEDGLEEETVYVVLELPENEPLPPPGARLRLEGMDTAEQRLEWEGGAALVGVYEEAVGTQLLFREEARGNEGGRAVALHCHTSNRIRFRRPPPPPLPPGGEGAEGEAEAAAGAGGGERRRRQRQQKDQEQGQQQQSQQQQQQQQGGGAPQGAAEGGEGGLPAEDGAQPMQM